MVRALAITGLFLSAVASEKTTVEIAPGVHMPLANMGGDTGTYSNYSLWLELGGRGLDTALSYIEGGVQKQVGEAVRNSGLSRSEIFVTTKIPCCPSGVELFDHFYCNDHPRDVPQPEKDIDATLAAIGIDYADLILLHWPCERWEDTVVTYTGLVKALADGKTRTIGVSNFNASALDRLMSAVNVPPAFNQCGFSIGNHAPEESPLGEDEVTAARCAEQNVTYGAYSALKQGDALKAQEVVDIAHNLNRSTAEVALRWIVQQGHTFTTASLKKEHLINDLAALTFNLSDDEMARLSAATADPEMIHALV